MGVGPKIHHPISEVCLSGVWNRISELKIPFLMIKQAADLILINAFIDDSEERTEIPVQGSEDMDIELDKDTNLEVFGEIKIETEDIKNLKSIILEDIKPEEEYQGKLFMTVCVYLYNIPNH